MERLELLSHIKPRSEISALSAPFLKAASDIIDQQEKYWPLSLRTVHYRLLSYEIVRTTRTGELYKNDYSTYHALGDLLLRARINDFVSWEAIEDTTRPVSKERGWLNAASSVAHEKDIFLEGDQRRLMQSQRAHIEVLADKLTVRSIFAPIVEKYALPLTIARGQCSGTVKQAIYDRFAASGKEKLVLLIASDLDPSGETIAAAFVKYFLRDCGLLREQLEAWKFSLTREQVDEFDFPPFLKAKPSDPTRAAYIAKHGDDAVYELDALTPQQLQSLLEKGILRVIDQSAFERELAREQKDIKAIAREKTRLLGR